jgi:trehalose 6-phosphate phosphatase
MPVALSLDALGPLRAERTKTAILLDIDGTLAPIVEIAADARVPERTRQLLIAVSKQYGVVACVSGRRASEARAMVSIGTISYLGSHGVELLKAGWTRPQLDPSVEEWASRIQEFSRDVDTPDLRRRRVRIEDKGAIVAFHWRGAPDEEAAHTAIDAVASKAEAAGLRTHWGRKVLEVRPPLRIDKGSGVTSFLEQTETEIVAAVYIGDDRTDLDAFHALDELARKGKLGRAVKIGVRSDEGPADIAGEADFLVDGTSGVRDLLEMLIAPDEPGSAPDEPGSAADKPTTAPSPPPVRAPDQ